MILEARVLDVGSASISPLTRFGHAAKLPRGLGLYLPKMVASYLVRARSYVIAAVQLSSIQSKSVPYLANLTVYLVLLQFRKR